MKKVIILMIMLSFTFFGVSFADDKKIEGVVWVGFCEDFKAPFGRISTSFSDAELGFGKTITVTDSDYCLTVGSTVSNSNLEDLEFLKKIIASPLPKEERSQFIKQIFKDGSIFSYPYALVIANKELKNTPKTEGWKELWKALLEGNTYKNTLPIIRKHGWLEGVPDKIESGDEMTKYLVRECQLGLNFAYMVKTGNPSVVESLLKEDPVIYCSEKTTLFFLEVIGNTVFMDKLINSNLDGIPDTIVKEMKIGAQKIKDVKKYNLRLLLPMLTRAISLSIVKQSTINAVSDSTIFYGTIMNFTHFAMMAGF